MWSSSYLEIGSPRVGLVNFREASVRSVGRRDGGRRCGRSGVGLRFESAGTRASSGSLGMHYSQRILNINGRRI